MNLEKLGVTKEDVMKYSQIKDTFKFESLDLGDSVVMEFLSNDVLETEVTAKQSNKEKGIVKGDKIKTPYIVVRVHSIHKANGEIMTYPEENEYTLWLSSKTLALGIGKIAENYNDDDEGVIGIKFRVTKDKASFKLGDNTCYKVIEILSEK